MATIRTWTNDTSLIEMDTNTYEKLEEILYMEEENKSKIMENIKEACKEIEEAKNNNICDIEIIEDKKGYYIRYTEYGIINKIFCFTLSEIIIHLRYLKRIY